MRALARSLVHGEFDADDLLQDAAVAALEHPPSLDRPVRPWLATVILNRWRMDRRSAARRRAREQAIGTPEPDRIDPLERAQTLRRLGEAVIALPDLYRDVVIARYFDGKSSVVIANELGIPAVTVRTRLLRALEKLRTAMDDTAPRRRWQRALVPMPLHAWLAPAKVISASIILAFLFACAYLVWPGERAATRSTTTPAAPAHAAAVRPALPDEPTAGQGRASVEPAQLAIASGRVIDGATGEGVANAELTFTGAAGASITRSGDDGSFELAADPGAYALASIVAAGYLPFVARHHSTRYELVRERAVRGLTLIVYPAVDYRGRVVDDDGKPVAGAKVAIVGEPGDTWTSDRAGEFTFHAAQGAVLEASAGDRVGWASVLPAVEVTHRLAIAVAHVPARDQTITGRVVDETGKPIADASVRAYPEHQKMDVWSKEAEKLSRTPSSTTSAADGTFELRGLDGDTYELSSEVEGRAPALLKKIAGGTRGVALELAAGQALAGTVAAADGSPVPAFTLFVFRRDGAARDLVLSRSLVDASGHFSVRVVPGAYELVAAANGWSQNAPVQASAPGGELRLVMSAGATLRGKVVSASDGSPIARARVTREALAGGTSAQPANVCTVTRADGTFELRGIPPGPVSIVVMGEGFDHKIEAGMTAREDGDLAPVQVALEPIAPGGTARLEYVGVGITTSADGDTLRIDALVPDGGAAAAGIVVGDHIVAVDGVPVADIGEAGAVARIRGIANTTVTFAVRRADQIVSIVVTRAWLSA